MGAYVKMTAAELTKQVWSGKAFFAKVTASEGKYLTSSVTYRGAFSTQEVDNCVAQVQAAQSEDFVEWIPNNIKSSVVLYPGKEYALSATFVANTTALKNVFDLITEYQDKQDAV